MSDEFDVSNFPLIGDKTEPSNVDMSKSIMSPEYRQRDAFGAQELGGLIVGAPFRFPLSTVGAGVGGFGGELYEQVSRGETPSLSLATQAGIEEAAWDAGGNLVLKGLGKVLRFGADKLGFTSKNAPDANKAAEEFLQRYNSTLPASQRTGANLFAALEGIVYTPVTFGVFKDKDKEIHQTLKKKYPDLTQDLRETQLTEGRYDKLTNELSSFAFELMKDGYDVGKKVVDELFVVGPEDEEVDIVSDDFEFDSTDTTITSKEVDVIKIAGANKVSVELLERSDPAYLDVLLRELAASWAQKADAYAFSIAVGAPGTSTGATLYASIADGIADSFGVLRRTPNRFLADTGNFAELLAAVDDNKRPLFAAAAPQNAAGLMTQGSTAGTIAGLGLVVDPNIDTGTGVKGVVYASDAATFYRGPAQQIRANVVSTGEIEIGVYGYVATCSKYPTAFRNLTVA